MSKPMPLATAEQFHKKLKINICKWCGTSLSNQRISMYVHPGGWKVDGHPGRWWLYIKCPVCKYDWNLEKLGVKKSL